MSPAVIHSGILGGTFDPIHRGHLAMARAAGRAARLAHIYFVPAPHPSHRPSPAASYADRFAMVALALARQPRWLPLAVPDPPRRPTFALDQIAWIEAWLQARGRRERLHWILGADAFLTLPSWHQYHRLLQRCDFIVLGRSGIGLSQVVAAIPSALVVHTSARRVKLAGGRQLHWLGRFSSPASSTRLRALPPRRAASQPKTSAMPAAVERYARRAGLYHWQRLGGDPSLGGRHGARPEAGKPSDQRERPKQIVASHHAPNL